MAETLGSIEHYDSLTGERVELTGGKQGIDLRLLDVDGDGIQELLAVWYRHWSLFPSYGGVYPWADWQIMGYLLDERDGSTPTTRTVRAAGDDVSLSPDFPPVLSWFAPVPVADLDGDGDLEVVFSTAGSWAYFMGTSRRLEVLDLSSQSMVWSLPEVDVTGYTPYAVSLWQWDDKRGLNLLISNYNRQLCAYDGATGDSLFVLSTDRDIAPVTAGYLDNSGVWKGIIVVRDTLFVIRFDPPAGVGDEGVQPESFELHANYPNPFNAATEIEYSLNAPGKVRLDVFNILGRHVSTLIDQIESAGRHTVRWDASGVGSGVYFYRLRVGDDVKTRKMVVLK